MKTSDSPVMTAQDLDFYLKSLDKAMIHYRAEQSARPNAYNIKQLKKLDKMAIEVIARFHEKDLK